MGEVDVVIVGAGPTGLALAVELGRSGVRPVVLERHAQVHERARAGGLNGRIVDVLRARGSLGRFAARSSVPPPPPRFPWGGLHVDFTRLPLAPMEAVVVPQPEMERVLEAHARELGADVRRGAEVVGLAPGPDGVRLQVAGPGGREVLEAGYVVGCDGGRSRIRELAAIGFPGTSYAEVERLGTMTRPESLAVTADGGLDVPGWGVIPFGYQATERGVFAFSAPGPDLLGLYTSEEDADAPDDDVPMTVEELGESVRRVLGVELPLGEPQRLTRFRYHARQADRYREGRVLLAGDAAHLFPAGGVAINAGMLDAVALGWRLAAVVRGWAPDDLLDSYAEERRDAAARTLLHTQAQVALRRGHDAPADALREVLGELLDDEAALRRLGALMTGDDRPCPAPGPEDHALVGTFAPVEGDGRAVLVEVGDRPALRRAVAPWEGRIEVRRASSVPLLEGAAEVDAALVRPDLRVAWAAAVGEPDERAVPALRAAATRWFGPPAG